MIIAVVPIWIALFDWLRPGGARPALRVVAGLAAGTTGLLILVGPPSANLGDRVDPVGAGVLLIATLCWASGTMYARRARLPASPLLATGMEMIMGGVVLLSMGLVGGELPAVNLAAISLRSGLALVYLIIFGALVAFSAFIFLLNNSTPTRAVTYAYVNPMVAVFLGWLFGGEPLTVRTLLAAAVIVGAVVLITTAPKPVLTRHSSPVTGTS